MAGSGQQSFRQEALPCSSLSPRVPLSYGFTGARCSALWLRSNASFHRSEPGHHLTTPAVRPPRAGMSLGQLRKLDDEARPAARTIFHPRCASVRLHVLGDHREP